MKKVLFIFVAFVAIVFSSCSNDTQNVDLTPASVVHNDSTVHSALSEQDYRATLSNIANNVRGTRSCDLDEEKMTEMLQPLSMDGKFIIEQIKNDSDLTSEEKDSLESLNEAQLAAVSFIVNTVQYDMPTTRVAYSKSTHCFMSAVFGYGIPGIGATCSVLGAMTKVCLKRLLFSCIGGLGAAITVGIVICEYQYCMAH